MKISAAALFFLILAAALGPSAHESSGGGSLSLDNELGSAIRDQDQSDWHYLRQFSAQGGVHRPTDCCHSYTRRNIRCVFMKSYYQTSSVCPLPAVIFKTKRGQEVCADPSNKRVRECMMKLPSKNTLGKWLVKEELQ